ncbi:hypothetical protein B0H14DRAFT_2412253 [Mycena olivaceomarginata]|nr:hypothetical protein B0H14DRAFT_2412253 [Mycena olivaceomarginata]
MSPLIAFIIGSGPNIGQHTAAALKAKGYQVALGSRKPLPDELRKEGYLSVIVDAEKPESVKAAFADVNKRLGPPNAVIFNAATFVAVPRPDDPLSLPVEVLETQNAVSLSVFVAAQEAVRGFRSDALKGTGALKTFIVTGNPLPWMPTVFRSLSIQKLANWRLMQIFASAYAAENIRFYYACLVGENGGLLEPFDDFLTSGPQHAKVYSDLVTRPDQADSEYRSVSLPHPLLLREFLIHFFWCSLGLLWTVNHGRNNGVTCPIEADQGGASRGTVDDLDMALS